MFKSKVTYKNQGAYYQRIELPDESLTSGKVDHSRDPAILGLSKAEIEGSRFLDIAANDGYWAFWAEKNGAKDILAIDVENYEDYDWGLHGVPSQYRNKPAKNENFDYLKDVFQSKVKREPISVYDLDHKKHGLFDYTFCYGLIYHLRHPLLAFDKMRQVTKGMCVTKTHTLQVDENKPYSIFFMDDVFDAAITNWTGATESCIVHWMKNAGFNEVFVDKDERSMGTRALFSKTYIGTVSQKHFEHMKKNSNFFHCDESYFYQARREVRKTLYPYSLK